MKQTYIDPHQKALHKMHLAYDAKLAAALEALAAHNYRLLASIALEMHEGCPIPLKGAQIWATSLSKLPGQQQCIFINVTNSYHRSNKK